MTSPVERIWAIPLAVSSELFGSEIRMISVFLIKDEATYRDK
jgi:hypothetical protein